MPVIETAPHLRSTEYHRQPDPLFYPHNPVKPSHLNIEHMLVQKDDGIMCLVLGRGGDSTYLGSYWGE